MTYWWCLTHSAVEDSQGEGPGCRNGDRLGPYDSRDEAASALQRARARTAEQDARDKAEDDW